MNLKITLKSQLLHSNRPLGDPNNQLNAWHKLSRKTNEHRNSKAENTSKEKFILKKVAQKKSVKKNNLISDNVSTFSRGSNITKSSLDNKIFNSRLNRSVDDVWEKEKKFVFRNKGIKINFERIRDIMEDREHKIEEAKNLAAKTNKYPFPKTTYQMEYVPLNVLVDNKPNKKVDKLVNEIHYNDDIERELPANWKKTEPHKKRESPKKRNPRPVSAANKPDNSRPFGACKRDEDPFLHWRNKSQYKTDYDPIYFTDNLLYNPEDRLIKLLPKDNVSNLMKPYTNYVNENVSVKSNSKKANSRPMSANKADDLFSTKRSDIDNTSVRSVSKRSDNKITIMGIKYAKANSIRSNSRRSDITSLIGSRDESANSVISNSRGSDITSIIGSVEDDGNSVGSKSKKSELTLIKGTKGEIAAYVKGMRRNESSAKKDLDLNSVRSKSRTVGTKSQKSSRSRRSSKSSKSSRRNKKRKFKLMTDINQGYNPEPMIINRSRCSSVESKQNKFQSKSEIVSKKNAFQSESTKPTFIQTCPTEPDEISIQDGCYFDFSKVRNGIDIESLRPENHFNNHNLLYEQVGGKSNISNVRNNLKNYQKRLINEVVTEPCEEYVVSNTNVNQNVIHKPKRFREEYEDLKFFPRTRKRYYKDTMETDQFFFKDDKVKNRSEF